MYGPTDTRIINLSGTLCDKVQLAVGESNPGYQVYLYTLNYPPTVIEHSSFHLLNERPFFQYAGDYQYYSYYMLTGSTFNVSACTLDPGQPRINFYVIKGHKNFANLEYGMPDHAEYHITINSLCQASNNSYSYSVISDDFYYLVFYYLVLDSEGYSALNVTMDFDLLHYKVYNHTVIEECHLNTSSRNFGSCSVGIPLSGHVTTLLQVMPAEDTEIDWKFSTYADVGCSPRIWMYVVVACCMLIGIVGPFALIYILCKCKKRAKSGSVDATEPITAPLLHPPNSNDYGSNYSAPPPYQS